MDLMSLMSILLPLLLLTAAFLWVLWMREKSFQIQLQEVQADKRDLLNRLMTKEWTSYAQLSQATNLSSTDFDDYPVGMSDEEEMRRNSQAASQPEYGETLVEVPTQESIQQELRDLGLLDDE